MQQILTTNSPYRPLCIRPRAISFPIPLLAPVTSATLPEERAAEPVWQATVCEARVVEELSAFAMVDGVLLVKSSQPVCNKYEEEFCSKQYLLPWDGFLSHLLRTFLGLGERGPPPSCVSWTWFRPLPSTVRLEECQSKHMHSATHVLPTVFIVPGACFLTVLTVRSASTTVYSHHGCLSRGW